MSGGLDVLQIREDDVTKMLAATTHIGSENADFQMSQYIFKRRTDGKKNLTDRIINYVGCNDVLIKHMSESLCKTKPFLNSIHISFKKYIGFDKIFLN